MYGIGLLITMFFFALFHWKLASKNLTTNEHLRKAYKNKPNPWDRGFKSNLNLFWSEYPSTKSNIFDMQNELIQDEEQFYYQILSRYGRLMYSEKDKESEIKQYQINGEVNMFGLEDNIIKGEHSTDMNDILDL